MFGNAPMIPMKADQEVLQQSLDVILSLYLKTVEIAKCIQHTMRFEMVGVIHACSMQSQELCYQKQQWEQDFSTRILIQNKHHPAIVSFIRIDLLLPSWRNTVFCDSQTGVERIAPDSGITTVTYPSLSVCVCVCVYKTRLCLDASTGTCRICSKNIFPTPSKQWKKCVNGNSNSSCTSKALQIVREEKMWRQWNKSIAGMDALSWRIERHAKGVACETKK